MASFARIFGRILVNQVVATLDGVEHVPFPVVFFSIAERCGNTALGGSGMRTRRVELADDRDVRFSGKLNRRH